MTELTLFYRILTVSSQVREYTSSHRDLTPTDSHYRWSSKKDAARQTNNEKQMTYHYLVTGG